MRQKTESKIYDLNQAVEKLKGKGDDDFMRMLVKLVRSKSFMTIPDWMLDVVLEEVEPSNFDAVTCYSKLLTMRYKNHERRHPANVLEEVTLSTPVVFTVRKIEYKDGVGKVVKLMNTKGLAMEEKKSLAFCAATTATILAYYIRGKGADLTERIKDDVSNRTLGFHYAPGLTAMRAAIESYEGSSTMARDEIYRKLTFPQNSGLNYHFSAMLATKFPDFYVPNADITTEMKIYYDNGNVALENRFPGSILEGQVPRVATGNELEVMWRYLDQSRSVRGQDAAGCGILTVGYYWGWELSRSFIKSISMAWDIMNVMKRAEVDTVCMFSQCLPANVVSILINNRKSVVVTSSTYPKAGMDSSPGLYSVTSKPSIFFYDYKFVEPVIKKSGINYCAIPAILGTNTHFFTYAYICPDLLDRRDIGFFPTTMPHQGRVILSNIVSSVPLEQFIPRCISANYFRNFFPLHRKGYWRYDKLSSYLNFNRELSLPSLTSIKMAKGMITGIDFQDPIVCQQYDDNELLIVDKIDTTETDKSYRIASWASRISDGQMGQDRDYLLGKGDNPSVILQGLLKFASKEDLLLSIKEYVPEDRGKEMEVPTSYALPESSITAEEGDNSEVNKAALRDISLPQDDF